jgi:hypothetical protein
MLQGSFISEWSRKEEKVKEHLDKLLAGGLALACLVIGMYLATNYQRKPEYVPPAATLSLEVKNDSLLLTSTVPPAEASMAIIDAFQQNSGNILNRARVIIDSLAFVNMRLSNASAAKDLRIEMLQEEIARLDSIYGEGR